MIRYDQNRCQLYQDERPLYVGFVRPTDDPDDNFEVERTIAADNAERLAFYFNMFDDVWPAEEPRSLETIKTFRDLISRFGRCSEHHRSTVLEIMGLYAGQGGG